MTSGFPRLGYSERELLLLCSRLELDADRALRLEELLRGGLAWDGLVWHARLHSVGPLLHHHLRRSSAYGEVPAPARQSLLRLSHRAAYQNRYFAEEHGALSETFEAAGVEPITPKGISLVELVYGSHALRPLIDLDYVVRPGQAQRAARALRERGYRQGRMRVADALYRWSCPQMYFTAKREIRLSVVMLLDPVNWPRLHRLSAEALWERAERAVVGGRESLLLSPTDLVLYLSVHTDNHGFLNRAALGSMPTDELLFAPWANNRLVRFTDLYEVIRHHDARVDWGALVARAHTAGVDEAARVSLSLTNELLGPAVPPEVLPSLRLRPRHRLRGLLVPRPDGEDGRLGRVASARWQGLRPGQQLRTMRFVGLLELAFPDAETLRAHYGRRSTVSLVPTYALHTASAVVRSSVSCASVALSRARRRWERARS